MNTYDYTEAMSALHSAFLDNNLTNDFWELVNCLDNKLVCHFNEQLMYYRCLEGKDFITIQGINNWYRTNKKITAKQKQLSVIAQLQFWNILETYN